MFGNASYEITASIAAIRAGCARGHRASTRAAPNADNTASDRPASTLWRAGTLMLPNGGTFS